MTVLGQHIEPIGVAILGATGFGGGELLRLLSMHPHIEVVAVQSRGNAGALIGDIHPHLRGLYQLSFVSEITNEFDGFSKVVIFSSVPHGKSGMVVEKHRMKYPHALIIDLSGDLRLSSEQSHLAHYCKSPFFPELRKTSVYGLPEKNRTEIQKSTLVANPGCLATASILSMLPFSKSTYEIEHAALHLATGSSGAGKDLKSTTHHPIRHANFYAYKPLEHQHLPEIIETLVHPGSINNKAAEQISFVPHSLPVSRGILCSAFLKMKVPTTQADISSLFENYYMDHPFIRLLQSSAAELENVVGSNFADISIHAKDHHVVVHVAIDNLVKGMAGQAIHNLNLMCGLPETTGLFFGGMRPV